MQSLLQVVYSISLSWAFLVKIMQMEYRDLRNTPVMSSDLPSALPRFTTTVPDQGTVYIHSPQLESCVHLTERIDNTVRIGRASPLIIV